MLTTEQLFDALPYVADIFEQLELDKEINRMREKAQAGGDMTEQQRQAGMTLFMYIFKNAHKCKDSFFPLVAILLDCSVEEAKKKPPAETFKALKTMLADEEVMGFFTNAVQEELRSQ